MAKEKTPRPAGKGWVWDEETGKWFRVRKLTPTSCFKLQGVREKYIRRIQAYPFLPKEECIEKSREAMLNGLSEKERKKLLKQSISESQQYKMAGNSITVDVMSYCFENLFFPNLAENTQMTLF